MSAIRGFLQVLLSTERLKRHLDGVFVQFWTRESLQLG